MSFSAELGLSKRNVTMHKLGSEVVSDFHFVSARSEIKTAVLLSIYVYAPLGTFYLVFFLEYD